MKVIKFLVYLIPCVFISSCLPDTLKGHNGLSDSISDSKNNGFFLKEYYCFDTTSVSKDGSFGYKEIWIEKKWLYKSKDIKVDRTGFQICLLLDSKLPRSFYEKWMIGTNYLHYLRPCGDSCLVGDIDSSYLNERTIKYLIQNGSNLNIDSFKDIIDSLEIRIKYLQWVNNGVRYPVVNNGVRYPVAQSGYNPLKNGVSYPLAIRQIEKGNILFNE